MCFSSMTIIDPQDYIPAATIFNHPEHKYREAPGISSTQIKTFARYSPAHYHSRFLEGRKDLKTSDAMLLGAMVHCLVLEPDYFDRRYFTEESLGAYPDVIRTVADMKHYCQDNGLPVQGVKDELAKRILAHNNTAPLYDLVKQSRKESHRKVVKQSMMDTAREIRDAVFRNPDAALLLSDGKPEVSVFARHENGLPIKCRCDWFRDGSGVCTDLKTCQSVSHDDFSRDVAKFHYHLQQAHYLTTLQQAGHEVDSFLFIAVETSPPYLCQVFELDRYGSMLAQGHYNRTMEKLRQCMEDGEWPGYSRRDTEELTLPCWFIRQVEMQS
ncbi:Exodeoxyribonuclease 8 [invertebrate metagenome]|uniref:Exodeoxyribonuclease 8 n=1 Tax=invertebrate metagenome TaxID=1711999 RepID=A0A2H9TC24_9ZZZZ